MHQLLCNFGILINFYIVPINGLSPSSNTVAYANWKASAGTWFGGVDQTTPLADTLSLYSNGAILNSFTAYGDLGSTPTNKIFTTPPGMRFFRLDILASQLNMDFSRYKLDGSFNPIFKVSSPDKDLTITFWL